MSFNWGCTMEKPQLNGWLQPQFHWIQQNWGCIVEPQDLILYRFWRVLESMEKSELRINEWHIMALNGWVFAMCPFTLSQLLPIRFMFFVETTLRFQPEKCHCDILLDSCRFAVGLYFSVKAVFFFNLSQQNRNHAPKFWHFAGFCTEILHFCPWISCTPNMKIVYL